jgi:DNA transformation protein
MSTAQPAFVSHCVELLSPLGAVRVRRMFGGWGLYVDELFVAIIAFERLYLKASADSRARFERAGCEPFVYDVKGQAVSLGYWTAPPEALDSPALMEPWARLALQAALSARAGKLKPAARPKKTPRAKAAARSAKGGP